MLVPAAFLAIYTISLCSFSSFFFSLSIFLNPWRCLWRVSAPSVMWVVSVSAWLGSGPFHGPSHLARRASRPGLKSLETCDFFFFFWTQGKACMPLSPHQRKGCEVTVSEVLVPSGLPVNLTISCKHKRAKRAMKASLGSVVLLSCSFIIFRKQLLKS